MLRVERALGQILGALHNEAVNEVLMRGAWLFWLQIPFIDNLHDFFAEGLELMFAKH